jgi:GNAT superfamily N-acetyltransferase
MYNSGMKEIQIRFAEAGDAPLLLEFIKGLAEYEHLENEVEATAELLRKTIFTDNKAEALIAEYEGRNAGFVIFFHNFSTFLGKPGLYIEDLFVKPEFRGKGLGKALLSFCARLAQERDCGRLEWSCLDWNEPSIKFYKSQGAEAMTGWTVYRKRVRNE